MTQDLCPQPDTGTLSHQCASPRTDLWHDATGLTLETGAASATYLRDPGGLLLSVSSGGTRSISR